MACNVVDEEVELGEEEEEGDSDGWEECDDSCAVAEHVCLFCERTFEDAVTTFLHCRTDHSFDIGRMKRLHCLECIGYIKLVNFIRRRHPDADIFNRVWSEGSAPWDSDEFMMPVIADDMLLQFDIEEMVDELVTPVDVGESGDGEDVMSVPVSEFSSLVARLKAAEDRAACTREGLETALADLEKMRVWAKDSLFSTDAAEARSESRSVCDGEDRLYFESYGHYSIHEEMLKDTVRTKSYRDAIYNNRELFDGKVVLDVGCGTGILSMFAASNGAKHVIAVDQSDIIYQAMDIVRENGLEDKITLLKGKMEEIELPVEKIDIIISEWMGYFLLYEAMLDTVLWARDRYLNPGGLILPDRCSLCIAGVSDLDSYRQRYAFWDDVYGFRMSCMKSAVIAESEVKLVDGAKVITEPYIIREIDMRTFKVADTEFTSKFSLAVKSSGPLTALIGYFDVEFQSLPNKVAFSTGPFSCPTHWKQTVFLLENPIDVAAGGSLNGQISCRKNPSDPRSLKISFSLDGRKTAVYLMD